MPADIKKYLVIVFLKKKKNPTQADAFYKRTKRNNKTELEITYKSRSVTC